MLTNTVKNGATKNNVTSIGDVRYQRYVKQFREAKKLGFQYETAAMFTLLDFEKTSICWKSPETPTFEDVIRKEGFCSLQRFRSFKRAASYYTRGQIETLGLESVCFIAIQPARIRPKVIEKVLEFRKSHASGPTLQYTNTVVQELRPKQKNTAPTYGQLKSYCETLKSEIRRLGGKIPTAPISG